ncbi:MAG: hypothetical protein ABIZ49_01770 [Opitutaceae bacterium]
MRTLLVGLIFAAIGAFDAYLNGKTAKALGRQALVGFFLGAIVWQVVRRIFLP